MKAYLDLLHRIRTHGRPHHDRTGVGTISVFGHQMRHDLSTGFPLLTTKRVHWKSIIVELLWFLRGETTLEYLHHHGVTIWDEWASPQGHLGPIYGQQWRRWKAPIPEDHESQRKFYTVDQIADLEFAIRQNPDSRRLCVSAWNPADVPQMAMPPCHPFWQCRVIEGKLNIHLAMRSTDAFLGLPFNFASYAALLQILAYRAGLAAGELVVSFGDLHIYNNHRDQVEEQLQREPRSLPWLHIDPAVRDLPLAQLEPNHFGILNYDPHPPIKAPVAI